LFRITTGNLKETLWRREAFLGKTGLGILSDPKLRKKEGGPCLAEQRVAWIKFVSHVRAYQIESDF